MPEYVALKGHIVKCGPRGATSLYNTSYIPWITRLFQVSREHCSKIGATVVKVHTVNVFPAEETTVLKQLCVKSIFYY